MPFATIPPLQILACDVLEISLSVLGSVSPRHSVVALDAYLRT